MNNEIKEIKINKANKSVTFINNEIAFSQFGIADEILDLITNLQQSLKDMTDINLENEKELTNLQQINDNLTTSLNKKIEEGINLQQEKEDYKSRCEKAIEYIMVDYNDCKKLIDKDDITDLTDSYWQGVAITSRDLLNILQNEGNKGEIR